MSNLTLMIGAYSSIKSCYLPLNCAMLPTQTVQPHTDRRLRSKSRDDFITPWCRLRFTDTVFTISATTAWHSLPTDIRDCRTEATF